MWNVFDIADQQMGYDGSPLSGTKRMLTFYLNAPTPAPKRSCREQQNDARESHTCRFGNFGNLSHGR
jgi:hypothetical protein